MITHKQKKRKLALSSHEIDQIIKEAEDNISEEWEEATDFQDDIDFLTRIIKQKGKIEIEEY